MYRKPSSRRIKRKSAPLNLVPILDAVFILIFYLLMSAQFFKTYEIGSDYPLSSNQPPPPQVEKRLNLIISMDENKIEIKKGLEESIHRVVSYTEEDYLGQLNTILVNLKKSYPKENVAIVSPSEKVPYKVLVKILDNIRNEYLSEGQARPLFNEIIFGNIDIE